VTSAALDSFRRGREATCRHRARRRRPLFTAGAGRFVPDPREILPSSRAEATRFGVPYVMAAVRPVKVVSTLVPALEVSPVRRRARSPQRARVADRLRESRSSCGGDRRRRASPRALRGKSTGRAGRSAATRPDLALSKGGARPDLEGALQGGRPSIPAGGPLSAVPDLSFFGRGLPLPQLAPRPRLRFALLPATAVGMSSPRPAGSEGALPDARLGDVRRRALVQSLANAATEWAYLPSSRRRPAGDR
jgi:hypothetical protein